MRNLVLAWLTLLVLLALEFGVSLLHFRPTLRPLLLLPTLAMLGIIVSSFMQVGRGPVVVRLFAAAGVLWLLILLALGSLDPLTRMNYPVTPQSVAGVGD